MIFRQLIDDDTKTYTYLLGDPWRREAVLIDPVRENLERDLSIVQQLGLDLRYVIDTHLHADHITSSGLLRARTGCKVVLPAAADVDEADLHVEDGDAITFGLQALEVRSTPGHTGACTSYVAVTRPMVFTGDTLLIRGCGRTDFQSGDAHTLYRSVRDKLFSLPEDTAVYPAHDYKGRTSSSIREERLYNPRLGGGKTEAQFVEIMDQLKLAYPRKIDVALPANERCGLVDGDEATAHGHGDEAFSWPMYRTATGAPDVPAVWLADHPDAVRLIDIRSAEERQGADGRLHGADHIPMDSLLDKAAGWDKDTPIVLYCRSGGRSDRMAIEMERRGFERVASLAGGVLKWAALGLPLEGGEQG